MTKVLVVATSKKTRGGITSVIKAHTKGKQWEKYHCKWIETHRDGNIITKILYCLKGYLQVVIFLPFYDIIHFHISEPISALRKLILMAYAKLWNKKTIVHFHAFSPTTTIKSKYCSLYKYLFTNADIVVVLSQVWKTWVNEIYNLQDKVKVIYNPCTTNISNHCYQKKNIILYAGTINARKGYSDMIKAFAKIAFKHTDWKIVFAGNGEIEQGKSLASKLGIEKQTQFLGWINGETKDKVFKEAKIFCLPSYAEGFPMAVLDAWSYGLPVITTPVGGIPDIADNEINILLFHPGDINTLSKLMEKIIEDTKLRNRISNNSNKLSQTIFNVNTINKKISTIYHSLESK